MSDHRPMLELMPVEATITRAAEPLLRSALELLPAKVMITDADGRVIHANAAAEEMLRRGDPLWLRHGRLAATMLARTLELQRAVRAAANCPSGGVAEVPLPFRNGHAAVGHVRPMAIPESQWSAGQPRRVAVLLTEPQGRSVPPLSALAELFDLTQSEMRVLAKIATGMNRKAAAAALGVADSTVKTHLDNLFLKTGTSDQAELGRLVERLSWPR